MAEAKHVPTEQVVDWIADYIADHGYSPTLQDIAGGLGFRAKSAAWYHVHRAIKTGDLAQVPRTGHTIRPTRLGPPTLGAEPASLPAPTTLRACPHCAHVERVPDSDQFVCPHCADVFRVSPLLTADQLRARIPQAVAHRQTRTAARLEHALANLLTMEA